MALSLDEVRRRKWGPSRHAQALQHGTVAVPANGPASYVPEIETWRPVPEIVGSADVNVNGQEPVVENLQGWHGPVIPGAPEDIPADMPPLENIPDGMPSLEYTPDDMPVASAALTPVWLGGGTLWHDVVHGMFVVGHNQGPWIGGPFISRELFHAHVVAHVTAYLAARVSAPTPGNGNATQARAIANGGG